MNPDPTSLVRRDLDAAVRRGWIETNGVTPAPRRRWTRWDLITDKHEREAAKYDHAHPFWTSGIHSRVEFWSNDNAELAAMTFHTYVPSEEKGIALWTEILAPLKKHGLTVRVQPSLYSWKFPGETILIEVWSPYA